VCILVIIKEFRTAAIVVIKLVVGVVSKGFISFSYKSRRRSI
jgi:hypothetical protein